MCGLSFEYTVLRLVTARNRCHFDDTSARTVRLHTEQIATPLTIITTPPHLICLSIYVHPFRPIVCKEGRKNTRRSCWERSFFFAVRIKLAKPPCHKVITLPISLTFFVSKESYKETASLLKKDYYLLPSLKSFFMWSYPRAIGDWRIRAMQQRPKNRAEKAKMIG